MDGLETRELASFVAVAEELHFGRAATRLGISQPALSKLIRRLERRLRVELFERTSRAVALTEPGQVLVREAHKVLDAAAAAAARTQRAATRDRHVILAMKPGGDAGLLPVILAAYRDEPGVAPIEVVFAADRVRMLRDGRADAALLYTPPDDTNGFDTEMVLSEPAVAVLPVSHPLARRTSLRMADLAGDTLHKHPAGGEAAPPISELMHLIALGRKVAVLPRSLTTPLRDDLTTVAMSDVPPSVLRLAWPAEETSPSTAALARVVTQLAEAHGPAPAAAGRNSDD